LAVAARSIDLFATNRIAALRDNFEGNLKLVLPVIIHSATTPRLSNTSCFSIYGVVGEDITHELASNGIIVGTGAACSSGAIQPPKTILAMGVDYQMANGTLRVSLSSSTTPDEIDVFLTKLIALHANSRT
jgi:cysteine desulfurase